MTLTLTLFVSLEFDCKSWCKRSVPLALSASHLQFSIVLDLNSWFSITLTLSLFFVSYECNAGDARVFFSQNWGGSQATPEVLVIGL